MQRADEFRIRAAIGGSRWLLIRQLLVEHGLLVTLGVFGAAAGPILVDCSACAARLPRLDLIHLDFALMSAIIVLCCGRVCVRVVPALRTSGATGQR